VGALLIGNPKIAAGLAPFLTMRCKAAMPIAVLCQQMGQLMKQGLFNLGL
jgi:hypothetical protein